MRKATLVLSVAAAVVLATAASAQPINYSEPYVPNAPAAATTGVVTGTVIGVGAAEGWFGGSVAGATLAGGAVGAAAAGGVAGLGTIAFIHSVTTPCQGWLIGLDVFNPGPSACGALAAAPEPRVVRRRHR